MHPVAVTSLVLHDRVQRYLASIHRRAIARPVGRIAYAIARQRRTEQPSTIFPTADEWHPQVAPHERATIQHRHIHAATLQPVAHHGALECAAPLQTVGIVAHGIRAGKLGRCAGREQPDRTKRCEHPCHRDRTPNAKDGPLPDRQDNAAVCRFPRQSGQRVNATLTPVLLQACDDDHGLDHGEKAGFAKCPNPQ